jgi:hypothetical protein
VPVSRLRSATRRWGKVFTAGAFQWAARQKKVLAGLDQASPYSGRPSPPQPSAAMDLDCRGSSAEQLAHLAPVQRLDEPRHASVGPGVEAVEPRDLVALKTNPG